MSFARGGMRDTDAQATVRRRNEPERPLKCMVFATASLSTLALSAVVLSHQLLPTFHRGPIGKPDASVAPFAPAETSPPPPTISLPSTDDGEREVRLARSLACVSRAQWHSRPETQASPASHRITRIVAPVAA